MIEALLKEHGLRDTKPRHLVLEVLEKARTPLSPYDIQKWIQEKGHSINAVTVYRTLRLFSDLDLVHTHPCDGRFTLCTMQGTSGHHGFLHCTTCHRITEFADERLCMIENRIAQKARFRSTSHVSEVLGICALCS